MKPLWWLPVGLVTGSALALLARVYPSVASAEPSQQQVAPNVRMMGAFGAAQVYRVSGKDHECYVLMSTSGSPIGIDCIEKR